MLVQWSLSLLYETNRVFIFWKVSEQLPDAKMWDKYLLLTVWYNEDHDGDLEGMNMTKIEHSW